MSSIGNWRQSAQVVRRSPERRPHRLRDRRDGEVRWHLSSLIPLPHFDVSRLEVPTKAVGIEQRKIPAVTRQLLPDSREQIRVGGKAQCERFVFLQAMRYELGK